MRPPFFVPAAAELFSPAAAEPPCSCGGRVNRFQHIRNLFDKTTPTAQYSTHISVQ